uniref:J domain-containing protein n=1 Tax=Palpitomonas bilix TaxID=652834 RepID=A0A7S3GI11_9EUKA
MGEEEKAQPKKEEEPERILNCSGNPYDILQLSETADLDTIKKTYRKMSLKVHPDRCKHEKAEEAFNAMKKAMQELEVPEKRKAYGDMIRKVKEKIRVELKKEKFRWELSGDDAFEEEVNKRLPAMLKYEMALVDERKSAYEQIILKNQRIKEKMDRMKAEEDAKRAQREEEEAEKWEENRDKRVNMWRDFKEGPKKKKKKIPKLFKPPTLKKENR